MYILLVAVQRQTFKLECEKTEEQDFEVLGNLQNLMTCVEKSLTCLKCKKKKLFRSRLEENRGSNAQDAKH